MMIRKGPFPNAGKSSIPAECRTLRPVGPLNFGVPVDKNEGIVKQHFP